jgi:SAM-dependent methyltransferase
LYKARNDREAAAFIDALVAFLQPAAGARMLDLACGNGRHSKHLAQMGFRVTGLDLAFSSIHEAQKWQSPTLQFRRHDMRTPFGTDGYDYIFNFFTSFGYFKDDSENNAVIKNITRALKQDGFVLFDYLNVPYAEKNLVPVEEKEIDGTLYHINRWCTERFFYKRIAVYDAGSTQPLEYVEKVARFTLPDFEDFFALHGLQTVAVFGDYDLNPYNAEYSKRLIVLARKSPAI